MSNTLKITRENFKIFLMSLALTMFIFSGLYAFVNGAAQTLTVTVAAAPISFSVTTDVFPSLTPGTPVAATSTLSVTTNNSGGWNVTLSCDDKTLTVACGSIGGLNVTELPDGVSWSIAAAAATTSAGNAAAITGGDNFLYFRVMTASGSVPFTASSWWGTSDVWYNASQLWAGIPSSTNVSRIGNAGNGSYSASAHLNTVNYYLDVSSGQATGSYEIALTFTGTLN